MALKELQSKAGWGQIQEKVQAGWGSAGGGGAGVQGSLAESPERAGGCSLGQGKGRSLGRGEGDVSQDNSLCKGKKRGVLEATYRKHFSS